MREERRVEVEADAALLRPRDPRCEVLGLDLVAVRDLALVDAVAGVQVEAVLAGDEPVVWMPPDAPPVVSNPPTSSPCQQCIEMLIFFSVLIAFSVSMPSFLYWAFAAS